MSSGSQHSKEHAAKALAPLLAAARVHLATFRPRVCPICHQVFAPTLRTDRRCLDCAHAADLPPA